MSNLTNKFINTNNFTPQENNLLLCILPLNDMQTTLPSPPSPPSHFNQSEIEVGDSWNQFNLTLQNHIPCRELITSADANVYLNVFSYYYIILALMPSEKLNTHTSH